MDPRLADRRRRVAEDRARSNLGRLLRFLVVLAVLAVAVWFLQSPFLSVSAISVTGASRIDPEPILARAEIVEGRPMVLLDTGRAEAVLAEDPWVAEASVARDWPTTVKVEVVERQPAAVVTFADGSHLVAEGGVVLESVSGPVPGLPRAMFPSISSQQAGEDLQIGGAVAFLTALPDRFHNDARVTTGSDGLVAQVAGFKVRLGRPFDMEDKAVVTAEVLASDLKEGSIITVVAPAAPAVLPPDASTPTQPDAGDDAEGANTGE